jgi:adenosylcobinamide-phosphate synthase
MSWPVGDPQALVLAVGLDLLLGDPPNRYHLVAWMGGLIERLRRVGPQAGRWRPLLAGAGICVCGGLLSLAIAAVVGWLRSWSGMLGVLIEAVVLKMTFSVRGLAEAGAAVEACLRAGQLAEARRLLSWHLVSRDTSTLTEPLVAAAAIESVAENTNDSVVAPWLFYLLAGLPAALAYRYANTADAMLGYRDAQREWLGKVPARLDDGLNWLPARLTAVLVLLTGWVVGGRSVGAVRVWWRDAGQTASPNAGHPMAAAAGVLAVALPKPGHYWLGAGQRLPEVADLRRAIMLLDAIAALALVGAVLGLVWLR